MTSRLLSQKAIPANTTSNQWLFNAGSSSHWVNPSYLLGNLLLATANIRH